MTKTQLKYATGLETWLDLFEFLLKGGYLVASPEAVTITSIVKPASPVKTTNTPKVPKPPPEYVINITELKALAFEEVYDRLPQDNSVDVVLELLDDLRAENRDSKQAVRSIHSFITNQVKRKV